MGYMKYDVRTGDYTFKHMVSEQVTGPFPEHYHTVYELLLFLDGDADFIIGHTTYHLKPHCLLVVQPGDLHRLVLKSGRRYERIVVRIDKALLSPDLHAQMQALGTVYDVRGTTLEEEFFRFDKHYRQVDESFRMTAFLGSLHIILSLLCSGKAEQVRADFINGDLARLMDHIQHHLPDIHTLDDLCHAVHLSPTTVKRLFHAHFQTPVMAYIRTQKCILARRLIREGVPCQQAGSRAGFEYYSSFYRMYLKAFGCPPGEEKP